MKKFILLIAVISLSLATTVYAQVVDLTDDANLNVSATVLAESIEITEEAALAFGNVGQGTNPTIAFTSGDAGVMLITGEVGANIYIQYPAGVALTGGDGNDLYVVFSVGNHATTAASAVAYASEAEVALADESGQGTMRLFIGGELFDEDQVSAIDSGSSGTFTGTATITAQYNSF